MDQQVPYKTILFLSANPKQDTPLRLDEEQREIKAGLERSKERDKFRLITEVAVRPCDLRRAMLDHNPQIVHFSGHGAGESGLVLEDDNGKHRLVDTEALTNLFELFKNQLECVLLNACYSEVQAKAIGMHIPYVIGMSDAIEDKVAIEFATAFYDAIGAGRDVEFAYKLACNSIQIGGSVQFILPQLYCQNVAHNNNYKNPQKKRNSMQLTPKFKKILDNTSIKFTHGSKENIILSDLFVFPPLKNVNDSTSEENLLITKEELWDYDDKIIIFGEEQSGKTSLSSHLFLKAYQKGYMPLLFDEENMNNSNIQSLIEKRVKYIYGNNCFEDFDLQERKICIIDNFSSKLNQKALNNLVKNLHNHFQSIVLIAQDSFNFVMPDFPILSDYRKIEILQFGNEHRSYLVEKWIELGYEETDKTSDYFKKKDQLIHHVNSLVRRNIVPAKPFFILLLLQGFEMARPQGYELSSQGHCYQYLIYQALEHAHIKQIDFDTYFNFLTEIGGKFLDCSSLVMDKSDLNEFLEEYKESYLIPDIKKVVDDLIDSSILIEAEGGIKFRYRYLFYFFAAKKLADTLDRGESTRDRIRQLVKTIHLEKSSNIILFLTHHSKNEWILDEILSSIIEIFSAEQEATLEAESLLFLQDFIKQVPDLVLEQREVKNERLNRDRQQDLIERQYQTVSEDDLEIDVNPENLMSKINKIFRSIEVCGQILRNRIGSLEKKSLESIVDESFSVSMRFLNLALKINSHFKEEVIIEIRNFLEQYPTVPDKKLSYQAQQIYLALNYWMILGVVNKVAFCMGSDKGREIYVNVANAKNSPASRLIQEIIELQFEKKIDFNKIENLHKEFSSNPICDRLLKHIVLRHCYMHDIGYKDRQKLAGILNISMQQQQLVNLAGTKAR
jgi:GTPase SAR1 family protein